MSDISRLENIATGVAGAVVGEEYLLCYNNFDGLHKSGMNNPDRFRWLPINESYFGDTPEIFTAIVTSGFLGNRIENYGHARKNRVLEFFGRHLPTITAVCSGAYYTLGETVLPQILPGTADIRDVPAVILTAIASPFVANYLRKNWNENWKDKITNMVYEAEEAQSK